MGLHQALADRLTVDLVAGARPNFVKLAPVMRGIGELDGVRARLVHTGQHYDASMSDVFFEELSIPAPDVHLEVGSGSHGTQTARILERYEGHLLQHRCAATVVFGDVNSTIACALAAVKLGVPVVHVEAGLRSFDRTMPEEINRLLTDAVSDLLLVTEPSGLENLVREGIAADRAHLVGNPMIDTLMRFLPTAQRRMKAADLGLAEKGYGLVTMHRPSNVDEPATLSRILSTLEGLGRRLPLVFPVHPRTKKAMAAIRWEGSTPGLRCLEPQSYIDNLSLMAGARVVLTDSGGMQEECAVLGVPCVTLRETTERPVTVKVGASRLVGNDPERIRSAFEDAVDGRWPAPGAIPLWDGHAGVRAAEAIGAWLGVDVPVRVAP